MLFFECMLLSEQFSTRVNKEYFANHFKIFVIKMEVFKVIIMIIRSVQFLFWTDSFNVVLNPT